MEKTKKAYEIVIDSIKEQIMNREKVKICRDSYGIYVTVSIIWKSQVCARILVSCVLVGSDVVVNEASTQPCAFETCCDSVLRV